MRGGTWPMVSQNACAHGLGRAITAFAYGFFKPCHALESRAFGLQRARNGIDWRYGRWAFFNRQVREEIWGAEEKF